MIRYGLLAGGLVLLLAACGTSGQETSETPAASDRPALEPVTGEAVPGGTVDLGQLTPVAPPAGDGEAVEMPAPGLPRPEVKMASLAMQDLAGRLGIDISEIVLLQTEMVEWPDAGLGCPAEGMVYAAVITPGYRITLQANGDTHIYHTDTRQQVILCLDGQAVPPVTP